MRNFKLALSASAAAAAVAITSPAMAQDSDETAAENTQDNAIIVTARRQSETLAEVPASAVSTVRAMRKARSRWWSMASLRPTRRS